MEGPRPRPDSGSDERHEQKTNQSRQKGRKHGSSKWRQAKRSYRRRHPLVLLVGIGHRSLPTGRQCEKKARLDQSETGPKTLIIGRTNTYLIPNHDCTYLEKSGTRKPLISTGAQQLASRRPDQADVSSPCRENRCAQCGSYRPDGGVRSGAGRQKSKGRSSRHTPQWRNACFVAKSRRQATSQ